VKKKAAITMPQYTSGAGGIRPKKDNQLPHGEEPSIKNFKHNDRRWYSTQYIITTIDTVGEFKNDAHFELECTEYHA